MHPLVKSFVLFFVVAILFHSVSGQAGDFENDMKIITYTDHEAILKRSLEMKARKLLVHDVLGDYNDGGPNSRHDPKKGKAPGEGGGGSSKYP